MAFYMCYNHKTPFFGGKYECAEALALDSVDPKELLCPKCVAKKTGGGKKKLCKVHGKDDNLWKCRFCCEPSVYVCGGSTHFCQQCHLIQESGDYLTKKARSKLPKCPGAKDCPLNGDHPAAGEEFYIGCQVCRLEAGKELIRVKYEKLAPKSMETVEDEAAARKIANRKLKDPFYRGR
jgi:hypothetical protein